jgi:eukaryotic-like serine/threonine-protein kinase
VKVCPKCSEVYPTEATVCSVDGAELKRTNDPYLGRTIAARYRLIRRLGVGGMATVYLARHVMIDRLSAIKILRQDLSLNPAHRERFLREARAVNRINHRNIVEITDFGEIDGVAYLVMEYVDGQTLHEELGSGPFAWARAARIALQISAALGRAHQMGVVHRDLKPENILLVRASDDADSNFEDIKIDLDPDAPPPSALPVDVVKLTDFGIAKIIDAPALTFSEHLFGTPGYIAPECIEGLPVDRRTDLYSLGVVLYEMVTGRLPYEGKGAELLTMPLVALPIPPSVRVAGLPPGLESLILRMLSKSQNDRPSDAFVVQDALNDLLRTHDARGLPHVSVPPQEPRDMSPTVIDGIPASFEAGVAPASRRTGSTGTGQASEVASALAEMGTQLDGMERAARLVGEHPAKVDRPEVASALAGLEAQLGGIERASRLSAEYQAKVDQLEATGREFRANLGHAIDALGRDRSRVHIQAAALGARHEILREGTRTAEGVGALDALIWEAATFGVEAERVRDQERDLSFQIETLQTQLNQANAHLEEELAEATGALEGALAAFRQLTNEFAQTLDAAAAEVTGPSA